MKPTKARPQFYAQCFASLQEIAREMGYCLLIHGSLDRDMDLVAVPWSDAPEEHVELLQAFNMYLNGERLSRPRGGDIRDLFMYSILPGNRSSYVINLKREGKFNNYKDEQFYLDISITQSPKNLSKVIEYGGRNAGKMARFYNDNGHTTTMTGFQRAELTRILKTNTPLEHLALKTDSELHEMWLIECEYPNPYTKRR